MPVKTNEYIKTRYLKGVGITGKSTMGWFYSFKLHIIINDKGELLDFIINQANVDDGASIKENNFFE